MLKVQRAPNPTEFAQPSLSRSRGGRSSPARGYKLGVFVPVWLVLPRCEGANLVMFKLSCKVISKLVFKGIIHGVPIDWNCLQGGQSTLVYPAECPKIGLLNGVFGRVSFFFS